MGSVRFRVRKMRRRPWPSAARVRPASVPARTPRGARTSTITGCRVAWPGLSSSPALTRRTPTKRTTLRLRGGRRTPLVAYAPSLSYAPPRSPEAAVPVHARYVQVFGNNTRSATLGACWMPAAPVSKRHGDAWPTTYWTPEPMDRRRRKSEGNPASHTGGGRHPHGLGYRGRQARGSASR